MFARISDWLTENRRRKLAWATATEPGVDGFTPLQRETEAAVRAVLEERGLRLVQRELIRTEGGAEQYVVADIPELSAKIWIYQDQTDVESPNASLRLERWDARTPTEHREKVVTFLRAL
jgi:hypothetical protein